MSPPAGQHGPGAGSSWGCACWTADAWRARYAEAGTVRAYGPARCRRVPRLRCHGLDAEPAHRLGLDLSDALPGHAVKLADLVQGLRLAVGQPEPHRVHAGLALGQRAEHRVQLLLQREADRLAGLDCLGVLDQVAELAVAGLAERLAPARTPLRPPAPYPQ